MAKKNFSIQSEEKSALGKLIFKLRDEKKISLRKFADAVGLSPSNMSYIEKGTNIPTAEVYEKIIKENIQHFKEYDIELNEKHHKYKKDSPSGTLKSIKKILPSNIKYQVNSSRVGTLRGEHTISIYGDEEYLEIKHTAQSRKIYAIGALKAARWLMCRKKGLFSYEDCIFKEK